MRVFSWSPVFSWVFSWVCVRVDLRSCVPFLSGQGDGDDRRALARVRLAHFFNEGQLKKASIGDLFRFVFQFVQTFLGDFSLEKLPLRRLEVLWEVIITIIIIIIITPPSSSSSPPGQLV